jgi:pimeloyl-ACP methyl ester carboxylesterase
MKGEIIHKGKKISYRDTGQGPVIVLLHGFLEDMRMWDYFRDRLSKKFRVITPDLPGFGRSECLGQVHLMEQMARVVNKILKQLEVKQCLMAGHSMGGYVALAFAEKYPGRLRGLCLFHSHAAADTPEAKLNRNRAIEAVRSDHGNFIFGFFPDLFAPGNVPRYEREILRMQDIAMKTSPQAIIAALEGMKYRTDKTDLLVSTGIPVMFILGKNDSRIPFEKTLAQAALPARSEVIILGGVGHMGFIEARKTCLQAIEAFAMKVL